MYWEIMTCLEKGSSDFLIGRITRNIMKTEIRLKVWGDYACFTRPELKVERLSYEVMTPSAARGILTAIYWKPSMQWVIDRIHVLKPILFTQIRRNELSERMVTPSKNLLAGGLGKLGILIEDNRQQRAATLLRDVAYIIEAHIDVIEEEGHCNSQNKHMEMFKRRASRGQCFHQPCLGNREFPASFELVDATEALPSCELPAEQLNRNLGLMFQDMIYIDCARKDEGAIKIINHKSSKDGKRIYKYQIANPRFFMSELKQGILHVPSLQQSIQ